MIFMENFTLDMLTLRLKIIFISCLVTISTGQICHSQDQFNNPRYGLPVHGFGDISISAAPNMLFNTPNTVQFAGGLKIRMFMSKHFSFDSDLVFGRDYVHGGPGLIGLPIWYVILSTLDNEAEIESFSNVLFYLAMGILSVEHISYHIPVKDAVEISPFLSLLRYKSAYEYGIYNETNRTNEQLSLAFGLEINKYFKSFLLSPYIECNIGYTDHKPGVNAGVYCGVFFPGVRFR